MAQEHFALSPQCNRRASIIGCVAYCRQQLMWWLDFTLGFEAYISMGLCHRIVGLEKGLKIELLCELLYF